MEDGVLGRVSLAALLVEMVYVRKPELAQIPHQCTGVTSVQGKALVSQIVQTDLVQVSLHLMVN